jgi:hypothetical protein
MAKDLFWLWNPTDNDAVMSHRVELAHSSGVAAKQLAAQARGRDDHDRRGERDEPRYFVLPAVVLRFLAMSVPQSASADWICE